jgi:hypothetical protein
MASNDRQESRKSNKSEKEFEIMKVFLNKGKSVLILVRKMLQDGNTTVPKTLNLEKTSENHYRELHGARYFCKKIEPMQKIRHL